jgi:hypothetical protein
LSVRSMNSAVLPLQGSTHYRVAFPVAPVAQYQKHCFIQ